MPLSLLEAMSYGNCCVTSDIAECVEVVEDKAVKFQKSNVESLSSLIQELINDNDKVIKYKLQSANYIIKKYNWDKVVEQTLELYNNT